MRVPDAPTQSIVSTVDPGYVAMASAMVGQERQPKVEPMSIDKVLSEPKAEAND